MAAACAASIVGSVSAASADTTGAPSSNYSQRSYVLPFTGSGNLAVQGHMVVDPAGGDVFISGGQTTSFVYVMDALGAPLGEISGQAGAMGMALSADGSTLYVADYGSDSIAAIDTATLTQTSSYATPGLAPVSLALAGGNLWFTSENNDAIDEVNLSTGAVSNSSAHTGYMGSMLVASPSAPNILVSGTQLVEPSTVYVYDVGSGTPVKTVGGDLNGTGQIDCENLGGMAITNDGKSLILGCGAPYYGIEASLSTMAEEQTYATGPYPSSVAVSSDDKVLIGVSDGDPVMDIFNVGDSAQIGGVGRASGANFAAVAWGPDDSISFALLLDPVATNPLTFITIDQYPTLALDAPAVVHPGPRYTVTGELALMGKPVAGAAVTVTQSVHTVGNTTLSTVGTFTTNASGAFSFTGQPFAAGTRVTYSATCTGWGPGVQINGTSSTDTIPAALPLRGGHPVTLNSSKGTVSSTDGNFDPLLPSLSANATTPESTTTFHSGVGTTVQQHDLAEAARNGASETTTGQAAAPSGLSVRTVAVADASSISGGFTVPVWVWLVSTVIAAATAFVIRSRHRAANE